MIFIDLWEHRYDYNPNTAAFSTYAYYRGMHIVRKVYNTIKKHNVNENINTTNLIDKRIDGTWYIPNPVNPAENFADKWYKNDNRKAKAFFQWVSWVNEDLVKILNQANTYNINESLKGCFGDELINKTSKRLSTPKNDMPKTLLGGALTPSTLNFPDKPVKPNKPAGFA